MALSESEELELLELEEQESASSQGMPETGLQKLAGGITNVMQNIDNPGRMWGNVPPESNQMAFRGDDIFSKAGEAVTDYLGQQKPLRDSPIIPALAGTAVSMANPMNWMSPAMKESPLPGHAMYKEAAQESGAKTLGFTKRFMNNPGAREKAHEVAQTMLDEGVITNPIKHPFSSGAKDMLDRTQMLNDASGQGIGEAISGLAKKGKKAFSGADITKEIEAQLSPKYKGGAYDAEAGIVREIVDTVKAHGNGPLDFKSAQALKEKLQDLGKFNINTDGAKANLYRRASGIVRDALDKSVTAADPGIASNYLTNKDLYGKSYQAEKALTNRLSSEQGNKSIGLTDTILAGAEIAAGSPSKALAAIGAKRMLERGYHSTKATLNNSLAKETIGPTQKKGLIAAGMNLNDETRRKAYSEFISKMRKKN